MKAKPINFTLSRSKMAALLVAGLCAPFLAEAQVPIERSAVGTPTDKDLAGDVSRYFGQKADLDRDRNRKLAKLDLDGDFNYDGTINNDDPADNGAFQQTPPGLVLGTGEMSKLIVRLTPYKIDYQGRAKVKLEVSGINRDVKTGEFGSVDEEIANMGHVVVWADAAKKEKLIDSRDPNMRSYEWTLDDRTFPANLQVVPRILYVEGVKPSPRHLGDIRLLIKIYDDNPNYDSNPKYDPRRWVKTFRPAFDHILLTVEPTPMEKHYINNNVEGVWLGGAASVYAPSTKAPAKVTP